MAVKASLRALPPRRSHQVSSRLPKHLLLLVAHVLPAAVGITDQARGVGHQDQALRVVQNLAGEVALSLQLGLDRP